MSLSARVAALATRVGAELSIIGEQTILTNDAAFTRAAGVGWLGGARIMRSRRAVTLVLSVQEFNGWGEGSRYLVGTVPDGFKPAIAAVGAATFHNGAASYIPTVAEIGVDGRVHVHTGTAPRLVALLITIEYITT